MNALTPWNSLNVFPSRLVNLADALFGGENATGAKKPWAPAVDIAEDEVGYHLKAELADVPPAAVKVVVRDGVLTVKGERKFEKKSDSAKYHLIERTFGEFQRSFSLPKDADGEKVSAEFKNGVLVVTVPKREEVKPKEIEVKVG